MSCNHCEKLRVKRKTRSSVGAQAQSGESGGMETKEHNVGVQCLAIIVRSCA